MRGSRTVPGIGEYEIPGVPSNTSWPAMRSSAATWADGDTLYMFGGDPGNQGLLNDLWMYNISSRMWTWISGYPLEQAKYRGFYGTQNVPSPENYPGSRAYTTTWTDQDGNMWMLGGYGCGELGKFSFIL